MQKFPTHTVDPVETVLGPVIVVRPPPSPVPPQVEAVSAFCANCGTALAGAYCAQCGQHVADYHRSVWRFLSDFLDNTFCWDNKFLRTVAPLLKRPGFLTQEFMSGRRVRYVHPLRLFLFTSAACLALIGFINHHTDHSSRHAKALRVASHGRASARTRGRSEERDEDEDGDEGKAAMPVPTIAPVPTVAAAAATPASHEASFGEKIQQVLAASTGKNPGLASVPPPHSFPPSSPLPAGGASAPGTPGERMHRASRDDGPVPARKEQASGAPAAGKSAAADQEVLEAKINRIIDKAGEAVESATSDEERARKIGQMVKMSSGSERAGKMAEALSEGVEQRLSWVGLALLPVFALLLRAVYWREDSYYFAHLVFSLHYHAFLFLFWAAWACAGIMMSWLPLAGLWNFLLACCLFLPGWYLYAALRRLYGEGRSRTTAKVFLLGTLHLFTILIGVVSAKAMAFFSV